MRRPASARQSGPALERLAACGPWRKPGSPNPALTGRLRSLSVNAMGEGNRSNWYAFDGDEIGFYSSIGSGPSNPGGFSSLS